MGINKFLSLSLMLLVLLSVSVTVNAQTVVVPLIEIAGSSAYLPFNLLVTFLRADHGVDSHFEAIGSSKPLLEKGLEAIAFKTSEVDTYTIWFSAIYGKAMNQTLWVTVYSGNIETLKYPIPVYAAKVSLTFKIRTSIQPNIEDQMNRVQSSLINELKGVGARMDSSLKGMNDRYDNLQLLMIVLVAVVGYNLFESLRRQQRGR